MAVHGKLLLSDHCYLEIPGNIIDVYKYHFTEFLSESLKDFSLHFFPKCVARKLDRSSSKEEPNVSTKLDEGCSYKCFIFRSLDKLIDSFIDSIKSEKKEKVDFKFLHKRNNKYYYTNSAGQFLCLLFGSRIKKNVTF